MSIDQSGRAFAPHVFVDQERFRPARRSSRRWPVGLALLLAVGAPALFLAGWGDSRASIAPPGPPRFSQVGFAEDQRLAPMIAFNPPETIGGKPHYQARMLPGDGERWDTLTAGGAGADAFVFRVTLRQAAAAHAKTSLFVELAQQSAEIGAAVVHATPPLFSATVRGPIEWEKVQLATLAGKRDCLGFRFARSGDIDLSGFACGGGGAPLDRNGLECLIDRLSPTHIGMETGVGQVLERDSTPEIVCPRSVG